MRFKIVACILLILSVASFVLAAPVPVQEVRKARADAVEGDENVTIVSGNRAPRGNPSKGEESDLYPPDLSGWTTPPDSPSTPDEASGSRLGVMPPSPLGGSKSPLLSGGTEVPLHPEGEIKSGTTTENQPALPSETKSVSWASWTKVKLPSGETISEPLPGETKSVSWDPLKKVKLPSGAIISEPLLPEIEEGHPGEVATQQSSSLEIEHSSSSIPPPPKSKGFVSNFKTYISKLGKFRPRFQRTIDTGALTFENIQVGESSNTLATSTTRRILRRVAGVF